MHVYVYISFHSLPFCYASGERRGARTKRLVPAFVKLTTWRANQAFRRERKERRQGGNHLPSLKNILQQLHSCHQDSESSSSDDETAFFCGAVCSGLLS